MGRLEPPLPPHVLRPCTATVLRRPVRRILKKGVTRGTHMKPHPLLVVEHKFCSPSLNTFKTDGMTPSAAFVNASGLVGDAKWLRLRLPRFNGYLSVSDDLLLFAWFSIPSWIHPRKNNVSIKARKGLCCTWANGTDRDAVSIDNTVSANPSCCIAISTAPLVPLFHVQHAHPCFN